MSVGLRELLGAATEAAIAAGDVALAHFRRGVDARRKADGSLVTQADHDVERMLRERIAADFPGDAILGEEFGATGSADAPRRWILDPIDGTFSFAHGVPLFGILIGVEVDGGAVVGVAHFPALDELIVAAKGLGCTRNGAPAHVSTCDTLSTALVLATDPLDRREAGAADRALRSAGARRGWGDAYGHVLVATGRADAMIDPSMSIWDCAALLPIVEEAGGRFTDLRGARTIDGGSAVSSNGRLHAEIIGTAPFRA